MQIDVNSLHLKGLTSQRHLQAASTAAAIYPDQVTAQNAPVDPEIMKEVQKAEEEQATETKAEADFASVRASSPELCFFCVQFAVVRLMPDCYLFAAMRLDTCRLNVILRSPT